MREGRRSLLRRLFALSFPQIREKQSELVPVNLSHDDGVFVLCCLFCGVMSFLKPLRRLGFIQRACWLSAFLTA
jgi:hypothetical protein